MIHSVFFCSLGMTLTRQARQHGTSTTVVPALMTMCSHFLVSVKSKESVDTEQAKRLPFGRKQLEKKKKECATVLHAVVLNGMVLRPVL